MNKNSFSDLYDCPTCYKKLIPKTKNLYCFSCDINYTIKDGVPEFFYGDSYWGIFTKEKMKHLNYQAELIGWESAMKKLLPMHAVEYTLDVTRTDMLNFINIEKNYEVLDLGASWGSLSTTISKTCKNL